MAPRLADLGFHVVAVDLPGHGKSSHRPLSVSSYLVLEYASTMMEVVDALGWEKFDILAHSLGGARGRGRLSASAPHAAHRRQRGVPHGRRLPAAGEPPHVRGVVRDADAQGGAGAG